MTKKLQNEIKVNPQMKENLERLIELFLKMSFIGFDELQMNEREEVVSLFGENLKYSVGNFEKRLNILEEKIQSLEKKL